MWSSQQPTNSLPPVAQHMNNVSAAFPGKVQEIQPGSQYRVGLFSSRCQLSFSVVITFPPGFPAMRPSMTVESPLAHSWIDGSMNIVGHQALQHWNPGHNLGRILKDVELEFSLRPPRVLPMAAPQVSQMVAPPPREPAQREQVELSFPEIETKTTEEIQELLDKEKMLLEFFESTKTCRKAKKAFKELEHQNVELARIENEDHLTDEAKNLSRQLEEGLNELAQEKQLLNALVQENKAVLEKFSITGIVKTFEKNIASLNSTSDDLLSNFIDGKSLDANEFLRDYSDLRSRLHQLSIDREKLEQIKNL